MISSAIDTEKNMTHDKNRRDRDVESYSYLHQQGQRNLR